MTIKDAVRESMPLDTMVEYFRLVANNHDACLKDTNGVFASTCHCCGDDNRGQKPSHEDRLRAIAWLADRGYGSVNNVKLP